MDKDIDIAKIKYVDLIKEKFPAVFEGFEDSGLIDLRYLLNHFICH